MKSDKAKCEAAYKKAAELLQVMEQEKTRFEEFIETVRGHMIGFQRDRDRMQSSIDRTRATVGTLKAELLKIAG